ncbi:hypothetical protein [Pseudomonas gingeri]|uniref:hypothetical protein n=1 Tax=Pseudomonas gingeri TaxID=117681 RepID=UPI00210CDD0C|nr:hypothetical protein [Pseudomonas gingeri]
MLARFKPSFAIPPAGLFLLLFSGLALAAQAAVEVDSLSAGGSDPIAATHRGAGEYTLRNASFTVGDLQKMQDQQQRNTAELEKLKRTINDQARTIEELKRGSGSSSSSSSSELSSLKRDVGDQGRDLDNLKRKVEDLSRKVK